MLDPEPVPAANAQPAFLGVDVGGTFTDAAVVRGGRVTTAKVPSTPADQSEGVMACARLALERAGTAPGEVAVFAHGMTVGTNALLEERGARTALLATEGFTDVLAIGRQARPELYRPCAAAPAPLVPAERRLPVAERVSAGGVLRPLDEASVRAACARLREDGVGVEAVAVALLFSFLEPGHERRVAELVAEELPGVHVSASHEVAGTIREYERTQTAVVDAYLSPLLRRYLERLAAAAAAEGLPEPLIMQSSGGVVSATAAARHAAWTILSGPAGGAVGSAQAGQRSGCGDVLSFDMGGTSSDVCLVADGRIAQAAERAVGGRPLSLPMVDIHTVGAGGGSIAYADPGGALRVGPRSAGADPGPACYGSGGAEPTVTDANLVLGYLAPDSVLAGGVALDLELAVAAVGDLGQRLGLTLGETAAGIARIANHEMLRALRVVTVERGVDPRAFALLAFGGAGPMHAAALAAELGIATVVCPRASGVLSALGLVISDRRRDVARSVLLTGEALGAEAVAAAVAELAGRARAELGEPGAAIEAAFDLRYRGQAFELTVPGDERPDPDSLRAAFEAAHAERYGFADPGAEVELVTVRVAAVAPGAAPELEGAGDGGCERLERDAWFDGERHATAVLRGEPPPGERLRGPAVVELPEATVVVPPGWAGAVDSAGAVVLEAG